MEEIKAKYESYIKDQRQMTPRSVRDYTWTIELLEKRIDILKALSYKEINDAIIDIKEKEGWSQSTVYKYSICIKAFYKWLHREQFIPHNPYPFSDWKKPRPESPRFLTESLFKSIVNDPHLTHQEYALFYALWDTGARIGEICSLRQGNVDLERGLVNIPYEISKGRYSYRNIPITEVCKQAIKSQILLVSNYGVTDWIFTGVDGQPLTVSGAQKIITAIGLRKTPARPAMRLHAHMFRHSFGIRMLEKGVPETIIQKWLGHQTLSMTSRYISMTAENSLNIFNKYVSESLVAQGN